MKNNLMRTMEVFMSESVLGILGIGWTIALLIMYHKVFSVYYFNLSRGLMKEVVGACMLGAIMAGVTLAYWYVSAVIIIVIGLSVSSKMKSKVPIIIAVICAIFLSFVGFTATMGDDGSSADIKPVVEMQYI